MSSSKDEYGCKAQASLNSAEKPIYLQNLLIFNTIISAKCAKVKQNTDL